MSVSPKHHSVLLENVFNLMQQRIVGRESEHLIDFTNHLFSTVSSRDLEGRSESDIYGACLSLWRQFESYDSSRPLVDVFNPNVSRHGWRSSQTIITICVKDMPFLVDSVRMTLKRLGISSHLFLHIPLAVRRDESYQVTHVESLASAQEDIEANTVFLIEVDTLSDNNDLKKLQAELLVVLGEVNDAVTDWKPMRERLQAIIKEYEHDKLPCSDETKDETLTFLKWVLDGHFTMLGFRSFMISTQDGDHMWHTKPDASLGLLKTSEQKGARLSERPLSAQKETLSSNPLILTKTNTLSRIHRPAYMDYIGIKRFNSDGKLVGEERFIGLYSASFYHSSASELPILKHKLLRVTDQLGFAPGSHAYKASINVLETYPRDELIQASESELSDIVMGVFQMQERGISRMFVRRDVFGRQYSCMVFVPREKYNTQLRRDTQALFQRAFNSDEDVGFNTYFSENIYARTHYTVKVTDNSEEIDIAEIERNMTELTKTWNDKFVEALLGAHGEAQARNLEQKYSDGFSRGYRETYLPSIAVADIEKFESLDNENTLDMLFYRPQETAVDSQTVKLKLFHKNEPIHLSTVLPILENFGLRVIDESPYMVKSTQGDIFWVMDFSMLHGTSHKLDLNMAQSLFQNAFAKVWSGELEDDAFNRLILGAGISGRKATILRAYAKYMWQLGSSFSLDYIAATLDSYPHIAELLVELFELRFNPDLRDAKTLPATIESQVVEQLDLVSNLDDDRIIRRYMDLINATLRTNFYQLTDSGDDKSFISFKIFCDDVPDMPLPRPKFEIFVYSPRVEGVHLRGGKVARGGLRWSDRKEDFRTEVLGLVKAQQVKNTVIVPVGAKGGFVCKQLPSDGGRAAFLAEGQACYRLFIRSLLDITDNIVHGDIVKPERVVCHDDDDPYLVVAADKGTATFSDIANGISEEFGFWLGDAFASGGSVGYDHKKMGITARGAWESVKRHFREIGVDCQNEEFTCIGIGDMAGDVFGNGMLLSEKTCLVAAFNHMHIFFDPSPDSKSSYAERQRLFNDPSLNWSNYDTSLISEGGGVFSRSAKTIELSSQMKKALGVRLSNVTPTELINLILKMKVDLLWNGGIGTYVKSSDESHSEVGDRANDNLRIDGKDLRAKIVGEGGNLGLTQLGRMEYALHGGRINTDFIDNAGGVDCSDNEVNIKILLNGLVNDGELTVKQRNQLLYDMTDDVAELVLDDCYRQTECISITELGGASLVKEQQRFIHYLERNEHLNRSLEFIPTDETLAERQRSHIGFTRPELSVLVAYGKMILKDMLNISEITENPYHSQLLHKAFPEALQKRFIEQMEAHPLRGEIIATKLANDIVNHAGLNFVFRMQEETGASVQEVANAYAIVKAVLNLDEVWSSIQTLDNRVQAETQLKMLEELRRYVRRSCRWYLRHGEKNSDLAFNVERFRQGYVKLSNELSTMLVKEEQKELNQKVKSLTSKHVPETVAFAVSSLSNLFSNFDIVQVAEDIGLPQEVVGKLYFTLGYELELHWFLMQINRQSVTNHWQALARASFREELDWQQRAITATLLKQQTEPKDADEVLANWMETNEEALSRWNHMMSEFKLGDTHEFAKFSVAMRELMLLSTNS